MIRWVEIRDRVWKEEDERIAREQAMIERERVLSEKVRTAEEQLRTVEEKARNAEALARDAEEKVRATEEKVRATEEKVRATEEKAFARLCERRLKRSLSALEREQLSAQMDALGLEALAERIADLDDVALAAWLAAAE